VAHKKIWKMFPILFSLFLLSACSGGGGESFSSGTTGGRSLPVSQGIAVDPYIIGAVFQEVAADGTVLQRQSSVSNQFGTFTFPAPLTQGSTVELKIANKGLHGGAPFQGMLRRTVDAGSNEPLIVSPMTTILANGATTDDLLLALNDAGLAGLTKADFYADPMNGLDIMTRGVTDRNLTGLQASMAIEAYMEITGNFHAGANELKDSGQFQILRSMVQAQQDMLSAAEFTRIRDTLADDPAITSPLILGDLIFAVLQQQQTLVALVKEDMATNGKFNPTLVDQTVQTNLEQNAAMVKAICQTRVSMPASLDGLTLYSENCSACHGAIDAATKAGRTAADIQDAINNDTGGMGFLAPLAPAELQAIADTLQAASPTPLPPGAPDGPVLYHDNCAGCHGALDVSSKKGRTSSGIQEAIDNNTGGMGFLSNLSATEIQAIADALQAASPTQQPPAAPDGATLYRDNCSGCHDALEATTKAGRTAADIESAISVNVGGMGYLSSLTSEEIQAIADVLPPAPPTDPATPPDGVALYNSECSGCHGTLDVTTKAGCTAVDIESAISANIGGMGYLSTLTAEEIQAIVDALPPAPPSPPSPPAAPEGATLYLNNCSGCHGALEATTKAGRTAADIESAISANIGGMGYLSSLTAQEIQAIADVLPPANSGGPDYSNCTACHGQPPSGSSFPNTAGAHASHVALPSISKDCGVCHAGAPHDSQVQVFIDARFDAESGAAAYNGDGTCSNVSCHGGQTTPDWWTGAIVVDTQCSSCHASGTSQYNSYFSGRHSLHLRQGFACTVCHNTGTLQNDHFSNLATPEFEQSPATTIGGGGSTRVGSYSSGTCSSIACHGSQRW
jgi:predicted CxxxxCH...CXXCH cytochrome family protein